MPQQEIADIQQTHPKTNTRYIPIPKWKEYHPWPPVGGLRHLAFYKDSNGFKTAFKKSGRNVLVDEAEFFRCLEKNSAGK
jgi:hypothetical protein